MRRAIWAAVFAIVLGAVAPSVTLAAVSTSPSHAVVPPSTGMETSTSSTNQTTGTPPTDYAVGAGSTESSGPASIDPRIVELYPNTLRGNDRGEYVTLRLPAGNWTLSDGESRLTVPVNSGDVTLTDTPGILPNDTDGAVVEATISLSNEGERLTLHRGNASGRTVDTVTYTNAPEGEVWVRGERSPWRPVGYTPRSPVSVGPTNATVFVLPDASGPPIETLRTAERRLLLAGYTFESERVTDALLDVARRGVRVRVLLEAEPVGGTTARQAGLLDRLAAAGVEVRVLGGASARFRYHHPKYAVVDDHAIVLTENWKPAGTGGADSRGWGVRLGSPSAADELASVFANDAGWRDARPWGEYRSGRTFTTAESATGTYPRRFAPARVEIRNATVLTAPGNAEAGVLRVIDGATDRVDVIQPTVQDGPMLAATRRAAERGVVVRILLSSAWYVSEENEALAATLNGWAERSGVPLTARVADPAGRYGKIHAKGVIADDVVLLGSLNWNPTSARENREVVVALHGVEVAAYYRHVFEADWRAGSRMVPPSMLLAAVGATAGAVLYARRKIAFA